VFVNFTIELVDEWGAVLQEELTVADNVARGGARVMTSLEFQVGDVLLLREAGGGGFATRAEVRGVTQVQPTVDRLHLRFIDTPAPERLLRL
jgi:N-methylhydantoinase B/oxoprolinase/acetone carboxylase alpha subunit